MPRLVIGGQLLFVLGHHQGAAFRAHHDLVARILEFGARDDPLAAPRRQQRRFVDEVHQIGAREARRAARDDLEVDVGRQRHLAHVDLEDLLAADEIGIGDDDLAVETARPQQGGIEHVGTVGRRDDDDAFVLLEAVHLDEQLIERLLALVVAAAQARAAMAPDRVDFIDEDDAGRVLLRLLEHVAHAARADADEHLDEVGARNREERHVGLAGDRARGQGLAGARWADEQHAARNSTAKASGTSADRAGIRRSPADLPWLRRRPRRPRTSRGHAPRSAAWPWTCRSPSLCLPAPCICRDRKIHTPRNANSGRTLTRRGHQP